MDTVARRKKSWKDLYAAKNGALVLIRFSGGECIPDVLPNSGRKKERIENALRNYRKQMDNASWLDDDFVPFLHPKTGTSLFAAAFGCRVHETEDNMPFALPMITTAKEAAKLKVPTLENSRLTEVFEIADALRQAEPDGLMKLPDIQSPLDIAALIWSKEEFFVAMIEEPEAVKELTAMTYELLTEFLDKWFERYGTEFSAHFPEYYMPYGITLSEDEIGALSPGQFREFATDNLNALSDRYGGAIGIHCCANSKHQWDNFKAVKGLKLLNLSQEQPVLDMAYDFFKDVCVQMHTFNPTRARTPGELPDKPRGRVVLTADAAIREDALEQLKYLREWGENYKPNN